MRGLGVGRRRMNSRYKGPLPSKANSTFVKRSSDAAAVPRTAEEIAEFYKDFFAGIPILDSFKIPKRASRSPRASSEIRSAHHPERPEPPMKFETRREFPRKRMEGFQGTRDGSCLRPERLPPPPPEPNEGPWEDSWEESPMVKPQTNPFVPTTPWHPVKVTKISKKEEIKSGSRRYKFHSDKNHEMSEDEDEEDDRSVGPLTTVSAGKSTQRELSVTGSSSYSSVIGKFEMLSLSSDDEIQSLSGKHDEDRTDDDDDQDILIIALTQEEMDEFKWLHVPSSSSSLRYAPKCNE